MHGNKDQKFTQPRSQVYLVGEKKREKPWKRDYKIFLITIVEKIYREKNKKKRNF